jgi:hypothetical protein
VIYRSVFHHIAQQVHSAVYVIVNFNELITKADEEWKIANDAFGIVCLEQSPFSLELRVCYELLRLYFWWPMFVKS